RGGGGQNVWEGLVDVSPRERRDVDSRRVGIGQKILVVCQGGEARLQRRQPLGRDARRRDERPRQGLLRQVKLHHLAVGIVLDEIERGRKVGKFRLFVQGSLHQQPAFLLAQPIGPRSLHAPP